MKKKTNTQILIPLTCILCVSMLLVSALSCQPIYVRCWVQRTFTYTQKKTKTTEFPCIFVIWNAISIHENNQQQNLKLSNKEGEHKLHEKTNEWKKK